LSREPYGFIAFGGLFGLFVCFLLWQLCVGYNKELASQLSEMQAQSMYQMTSAVTFRQRRVKLQDLKPKLKVIEQRLKTISGKDASCLSTSKSSGDILFDASKLFDALDADGNGELDYRYVKWSSFQGE
jgi:hypothetical protein